MIDDDRWGHENVTATQDVVVNQVAACTVIRLITDHATGEVRDGGDDVHGTRQNGGILMKAQVMLYSSLCRACGYVVMWLSSMQNFVEIDTLMKGRI